MPHIFTTLWLIMATCYCQRKHGHWLLSDTFRTGSNAFVQSYLDLLIWWRCVIVLPQAFLDPPLLPSLDKLRNPTSPISSDQRTKIVFHSLRNHGKQSWFLDSDCALDMFYLLCQGSGFVSVAVTKNILIYRRQGFISVHNSRLQSAIKAGPSNS